MPGNKTMSPLLRKKLDRFWVSLFLTPEGKPKSAKLLYSFCLSIVFVIIYGLGYWFLIDPLEHAFAGASPQIRNLFESICPGLAGSVVCCSLYFTFKDKAYMVFIYAWITVLAIASLVTLLLTTQRENMGVMLRIYAMLVPTGLISGLLFSCIAYARRRRKKS